MKKGYIVRKSKKTVFVKSTATDEEIKFITDTYGRLGWLILPCKNEKAKANKSAKAKEEKEYTVDEKFEIPYDKVKKEHILKYAEKYLSPEEYTAFIKTAYTIKEDNNGKKTPSYRHIKAKDFIYKTKFAERFTEIENRRNKKKAPKKPETSEADLKILEILGA